MSPGHQRIQQFPTLPTGIHNFLFLIVKSFRMIVDLNGTDNGKQKMFTAEGKLRS